MESAIQYLRKGLTGGRSWRVRLNFQTCPWRFRWLGWLLVGIILFVGVVGTEGAIAQGSGASTTGPTDLMLEQSHVSVDGYGLFEVGASGNFSATQRGQWISETLDRQLEEIIQAKAPVDVQLATRSGQQILLLNGRYVMSVTKADIQPGMLPKEQAQVWQNAIEQTLNRALDNRTPETLTRHGIQGAIAFAITGLVHFGLRWFGRSQRRRSIRRHGETLDASSATPSPARQPAPQRSLLLLLIGVIQVSLWIGTAVYCAMLFPPSRRFSYWIYCRGQEVFSANLLRLGDSDISLISIGWLLIFVGLWWVVVHWFGGVFRRHILPLTGIDPTLKNAMSSYAQYMLLIMGVIIIVSVIGLDLGAIAIILGGFGVGIGFALQNIAKDFISGIIMLVERPVKVGEMIQVGDTTGWVKHIGPRFTELSHLDRYVIRVPNSNFVEGTVSNYRRSGLLRLKIDVGVAYGSDVMLVRDLLLAAALDPHPELLRHPSPTVLFLSWDDSAIVLRLIAFIREPTKAPRLEALLRERIHTKLQEYNIEIPFSQRDLNVNLPHLDRVVETWLGDRGHPIPPTPTMPIKHPQVSMAVDWDGLVREMRGKDGLPIRDRTFGFRTFRQCFTGLEAVRWLMHRERATREEAVRLGQQLLAMGIIHHVLDEHNFEDALYFYRFREDDPEEPERGAIPGESAPSIPRPAIAPDDLPDADAALEEETEALCHLPDPEIDDSAPEI